MLGFGPIGTTPIGASGDYDWVGIANQKTTLTISSLINPDSKLVIPERKVAEGLLVKDISSLWRSVAKALAQDWTAAQLLSPEQWEHIIAGAFHKEGYEVTVTPRSGDLGRDVIAIKHGIGSVKILGSVKAYKPGHLVTQDDVRALAGVLAAERDASKGILATTSDFSPRLREDKLIAPLMPTRLELMNGTTLQRWLSELSG